MELKIEINGSLALWLGPNDSVQVSMDLGERVKCREALSNALNLLDQTIVKWSTFSTATATGAAEIRNLPRLDGCHAVFDCSHP